MVTDVYSTLIIVRSERCLQPAEGDHTLGFRECPTGDVTENPEAGIHEGDPEKLTQLVLGEDQPLNSACKEHLYSSVLSRKTFKKLQLYSRASLQGLANLFLLLHSPIDKRDWMLKIKRTHSSEPDHGFPLFFVVQNLNFGLP